MKKVLAVLAAVSGICLSLPALAKSYDLLGIASIDLPSSYKVSMPAAEKDHKSRIVVMAADGRRGCMIRVDNFGLRMSDDEFNEETVDDYQHFVTTHLMPKGGKITHQAYTHSINGMPAKTVDVLTEAAGQRVPARFTAINLHNQTRLFVVELASDPHYKVPCLQETARYVRSLKSLNRARN